MIKDPKYREYLKHLSLGTEIAVGLSAPIFIGYWADSKWNTSPLFLLIGIFIGIALLIATTIRLIKSLENDN